MTGVQWNFISVGNIGVELEAWKPFPLDIIWTLDPFLKVSFTQFNYLPSSRKSLI